MGALSKIAREKALFEEALRLAREMFAPYEGARPSVPQLVMPRSPTGRQTVDPVMERAIRDREVKDKMMAAIERGRPLAGWYNMEPTRLLWGDITGSPDIGTHRFNRFQDFMGPTSQQSGVDLNIGNASRWGYYDATGQQPPEILDATGKHFAVPPPPGYGSKGQVGQYKAALPLLESGQPLDPLVHRKMARYAGDLQGNLANAAIDAHATRAPLMHLGDPEGLKTSAKLEKGGAPFNAQERFAEQGGNILELPVTWWKESPPNAASYYAMEDYYKMLGNEAGLDPAEAQAASWVGNAGMTGVKTDPSKTAQQLFEMRVANQAVKTGMSPRDILTQLMLSRGHLALGGAGLGLGASMLPGGEGRDGRL